MTRRRLAIVMCALSAVACESPRAGTSAATSARRVEIGLPAPEYATLSLGGDSVSFAREKGRVILVNIWATWCHPCRDEIPVLLAVRERYKGRPFELIGVSVDTDGSDDAIRTFMKDYRMTFPIWRDPDERITSLFLAVGVPATYLIDKDGILRWKKVGPIAPNDTSLAGAIDRALGS